MLHKSSRVFRAVAAAIATLMLVLHIPATATYAGADAANRWDIEEDLHLTVPAWGNGLIRLRRDAGVRFSDLRHNTIEVGPRSNPAINDDLMVWTAHNGVNDVVQYFAGTAHNACGLGEDSFDISYRAHVINEGWKNVLLHVYVTVTNPLGGTAPHGYTAPVLNLGHVQPGETVANVPVLTSGSDTDTWGHPVQLTAVDVSVGQGEAHVNPDGRSVSYTAPADYSGPVQLTYSVEHVHNWHDRDSCALTDSDTIGGMVSGPAQSVDLQTELTVRLGKSGAVDLLNPEALPTALYEAITPGSVETMEHPARAGATATLTNDTVLVYAAGTDCCNLDDDEVTVTYEALGADGLYTVTLRVLVDIRNPVGTKAAHAYAALDMTENVDAGESLTLLVLPPDAIDAWGHPVQVEWASLDPGHPGAVEFSGATVTYHAPEDFHGEVVITYGLGHSNEADNWCGLDSEGVLRITVTDPESEDPDAQPPVQPPTEQDPNDPPPPPRPTPDGDGEPGPETGTGTELPQPDVEAEPTPELEAQPAPAAGPDLNQDLPFTGGAYVWQLLAGAVLTGSGLMTGAIRRRRGAGA